jgi:hypothetical protein
VPLYIAAAVVMTVVWWVALVLFARWLVAAVV